MNAIGPCNAFYGSVVPIHFFSDRVRVLIFEYSPIPSTDTNTLYIFVEQFFSFRIDLVAYICRNIWQPARNAAISNSSSAERGEYWALFGAFWLLCVLFWSHHSNVQYLIKVLGAFSRYRYEYTALVSDPIPMPGIGSEQHQNSPVRLELRIGVGQSHEELMLENDGSLFEYGRRFVIQGCCPLDVKAFKTLVQKYSLPFFGTMINVV